MKLSRRQVILGLLGIGGSRIFVACKLSPIITPKKLPVFAADQLKVLTAAAERILPGSKDAGVADYLGYWMRKEPFVRAMDWKPLLNVGAIHLDRVARKKHNRSFCHCNTNQQDAILKHFEQGRISAKRFSSRLFFQRLVVLTLESYLSDPKYGGNRNQVGWHFIGKKPCWWAPRAKRLETS